VCFNDVTRMVSRTQKTIRSKRLKDGPVAIIRFRAIQVTGAIHIANVPDLAKQFVKDLVLSDDHEFFFA
jgi:hypothetical protein